MTPPSVVGDDDEAALGRGLARDALALEAPGVGVPGDGLFVLWNATMTDRVYIPGRGHGPPRPQFSPGLEVVFAGRRDLTRERSGPRCEPVRNLMPVRGPDATHPQGPPVLKTLQAVHS
jgi:hypothetical protein